MEIRASSRVRVGAFELDLRAGELQRGEERVVLQEQPLQVLRLLVEARGGIVTREEIKKKLWPNDTVVEFDHSIQTAISKLRKALDNSADNPSYIETVARRGYRLMVPVESVSADETSAEEASRDSSSAPDSGKGADSNSEAVPKAKLTVGRLTGKVVSHYRVLEVIGGGGMGLVYRAEDLKLGRAVALKFLPEEVGDDPTARERFDREAHAVSALNHANICTVYDFDEHEGHPFLAMELLQGKTLRDHLADGRFRLTQPEGLEIAIQIASGLEAAHEKGIVHRDIKPANIFVTDKNVAKILDFGVAKIVALSDPSSAVILSDERSEESKDPYGNDNARIGVLRLAAQNQGISLSMTAKESTLTRTGLKLGTAGYMSPEQVRGEPLDARTDIFSFGLVLHEMATGERAFTGNTIAAINDAILHRAPSPMREANPKSSVKLETIVTKCLEKDRSKRYQHTSELKTELQRRVRRAERSRWLWVAFIAFFLMLSVLAIWIASRRPKPPPEPKLTQLTSNFNENPIRAGAISPDNKYLAYVDMQGLHLRDLKTGKTRNLASPSVNGHPVRTVDNIDWWPDGSAIIGNDVVPPERQTQGANSRTWLIPVSGDQPRLFREGGEIAAVSPDGQAVLFNTNRGPIGYREVWQMDSSGGHERLLLQSDKDNAALGLNWLGESRFAYIAVDKLGARVESRQLSGGPATIALTFQNAGSKSNLQSIITLRNGRIFYLLAEPLSNNFSCTLWGTRIDSETGKLTEEPRRLTSKTRSCVSLMSATPDGQRVVFLEWSPEESIAVADLAPNGTSISNSRRITPSEAYYLAAWTTDSEEVVYKAWHDGQSGIFRQSIADGRAEPIVASLPKNHLASGSTGTANFSLNGTSPRSTPDGKFLLYTLYTSFDQQSATPQRQILRVPVSGGTPEVVLTAEIYGRPDCSTAPHDLCAFSERSQDRAQIVFKSFDPFSGSSRQIATFASDVKADYRWGLSPTADCIALVNNQEPTIDLIYVDGRPSQRIAVKAYTNFDWLYWSSDRKGFYVSTLEDEGSLLLYIDLRGRSKTVWKEKGGLGTKGIPSPDGKHIAMQSWTLATNLWMMENF